MFQPLRDQKPHFFGKVSLSWYFMQDFWKQYMFNILCQITFRKNSFRWNLDFCGSYFQWPLWNWGFGYNMTSKAAVTMQFEHLAANNCVIVCKKGQKNNLFLHCYTKSSKYLKRKTSHWSKVFKRTIWYFYKQMHISF